MKIQVTIDIDIKIEADKTEVAEIVTNNLREYLTKYLRQVENNVSVMTKVE